MTTKTRETKMSHRLAAAMTAGVMAGGASTDAHATVASISDFQTLTNNISQAGDNFTRLMTLLGYVGGSGFAIAGIYKLKQHVDNPGNTPLKDGMMRLAAGGALLSLPLIVRVIQGSIANANTNNVSVQNMNTFTGAEIGP